MKEKIREILEEFAEAVGDEYMLKTWKAGRDNSISMARDEAIASILALIMPKPEPEAWGELGANILTEWGDIRRDDEGQEEEGVRNHIRGEMRRFEAAWPEIKRRVGRMIKEAQSDSRQNEQQFIDHAIKAERERLVRALRNVVQGLMGGPAEVESVILGSTLQLIILELGASK